MSLKLVSSGATIVFSELSYRRPSLNGASLRRQVGRPFDKSKWLAEGV